MVLSLKNRRDGKEKDVGVLGAPAVLKLGPILLEQKLISANDAVSDDDDDDPTGNVNGGDCSDNGNNGGNGDSGNGNSGNDDDDKNSDSDNDDDDAGKGDALPLESILMSVLRTLQAFTAYPRLSSRVSAIKFGSKR